MYLQNKYTRWYYSIITRAQARDNSLYSYPEEHHIIPVSFYSENNRKNQSKGWIDGNPNDATNLVMLTIREHRLCHILLVRMTTGVARRKMVMAAKFMLDRSYVGHGISVGRVYEAIKIEARKATGDRHRGKVRTAAEIAKQTATRKERGGYPQSEEKRARISATMKGMKKSPETVAKFKATMADKQYKRSPESNAKMLATRAAKGEAYAEAVKAKHRASRLANLAKKTPQ